MPHTATLEDIKAYQEKVEKNKITPFNLPSCLRCQYESQFFKVHAYRERRFLIIVKMIVEAVFCTLVRFKCPNCGKSYTWYPDFALPHKHYTRQTIASFSKSYIEDDQKTYETAVVLDDSAPGHPDDKGVLAGSTVHRWISTLSDLIIACQNAFSTSAQKRPYHNPARLTIPKKKYKTNNRKACLLRCRWFFNAESFLTNKFSPSLQVNTS